MKVAFFQPIVILATLSAAGCLHDFDAAFAGAPIDASVAPDVSAEAGADAPIEVEDAKIDQDLPGEASVDAAKDAPEDAPCVKGTKLCGAGCVTVDLPEYGCGSKDCAPCALAHATATCSGGTCAIGSCKTAFVDCDGDPLNGCETALGALAAIDRTTITTSATAYGCCGGSRCSCNAVDGDVSTSWGSWECSEGNELCTIEFSFSSAVRLARMVIHQGTAPAGLDVTFGNDLAYSGPGSVTIEAIRGRPAAVGSASAHETAFPSGGGWWNISEVEFYRCP